MADVASALAQEPGVEPVLFNPLAFGRNAVRSAVAAALALPGRALTAAGDLQRTGDQYDPAPAVDAAMMTMGGTAFGAPKGAMGAGPPIRAYHGSPHDFERFDISKIGTGEGAQAYGHGLYFAEKEGTARSYRDALAGKSPDIVEQLANQALMQEAGPRVAAQSLRQRAMAERQSPFSGIDPTHMEAAAAKLESGWQMPKGHMYEVNINAAPEHFLDWDKPLAGQSEVVRSAISSNPAGAWLLGQSPPAMGREAYHSVIGNLGQSPGKATAAFSEAGIPGIKYFDQGSRLASTGSNNYVVFNDKLIDILRKYQIAGIAPPAALVAAAQQDSGQQQ